MNADPWPLRGLVVRTPRLELRPEDDPGIFELAEVAARGVHPPEVMPFVPEWTDAPPEKLRTNLLQFYWRSRASFTPEKWTLHFLVRLDGRVIGTQAIGGEHFAITRELGTGSWIGMDHQRNGYGTEMRAAALMFAFDHLGAERVNSTAMADNPKSRAVSRKLGYTEETGPRAVRRGRSTETVRFALDADRFARHRPDWDVTVTGLPACLGLLGLTDKAV
ncbi:GNAT family N-acetyltransferase [Allokutzneria oryzae]|uniref:GNAT family N-acetyltransferase n=1 Tax=Allokutzneria oryzae TaxID=1378989 RepID=A0ABV5ZZP3_9PSEU